MPEEVTEQDRKQDEEAVDAVLAEFGGDARATIAGLLHDIAILAGGFDATVSHGFVRRRVVAVRKP